MVKEKLVRFSSNNTPSYPTAASRDQGLKYLQRLCYASIADNDSYEFVIEDNKLYMTHPGGIVASWWSKDKTRLIATIMSALPNKAPHFKRSKSEGNFLDYPY